MPHNSSAAAYPPLLGVAVPTSEWMRTAAASLANSYCLVCACADFQVGWNKHIVCHPGDSYLCPGLHSRHMLLNATPDAHCPGQTTWQSSRDLDL